MKNYFILITISFILLSCGALLFLIDNVAIEIIAGITLCSGLLLVFSLLLKIRIENKRSTLRKAPKIEYARS